MYFNPVFDIIKLTFMCVNQSNGANHQENNCSERSYVKKKNEYDSIFNARFLMEFIARSKQVLNLK